MFGAGGGVVSPQQTEQSPLYFPNENAYQPWIDVFEYTHEAGGSEGPVDLIGIAMGADGMREPKASVVQDGLVLEITSNVPSIRVDFDSVYEDQQEKYMEIMGDKRASKEAKKTNKRKYNMMEAQRTAQAKAVREMRNTKGTNWKKQVTRVPLDIPVEKNIASFVHHKGEDGEGDALFIRLKVVKEDEHVDAIAATSALSPEK